MPAEIPGYYFDATKKKYFRIQPNHIAPVGSQYSRQAVNAANAIEREERQDRGLQASKRQAQVIRSDLLRHPLLTFDRRLGYQTVSPTDIAANYFSSAVVGRDAIHFPRGLFGRLEDYFDTFDVEPETGNLCAAARLREGSAVRVFYSGHGNGGAVYRRDHSSVIPACPGKISCVLAFAPALVVWSADRLVSSTSIMFIGDATHAHTPAYHVTTSFTISAKIWDMAASPNRSCWALATSDGVQIRQGGGTAIGNQVLHSRVSEEQMTVQFKDENTFMAGARSGKVTFGDVRGGLVLRLRHPSGVSGLRVLRDSNYILVNGLQHVCLRDSPLIYSLEILIVLTTFIPTDAHLRPPLRTHANLCQIQSKTAAQSLARVYNAGYPRFHNSANPHPETIWPRFRLRPGTQHHRLFLD